MSWTWFCQLQITCHKSQQMLTVGVGRLTLFALQSPFPFAFTYPPAKKKKKKSPTHLATFTSNAKTRCNFHCLALTLGLLAKSKLTNCAASAIWRAKISNICQRFVYLLADACFLFAATISDVSSWRKESWWGGAAPVQTWPLGK